MSFVLSKLLWPLTTPSNLLALALIAGGALALLPWHTLWHRLGRRLLAVGLIALLLAMLLPVDHWLARPLEQRFPAPAALPGAVDGIVVLGGGVGRSRVPVLGGAQLNQAADRVAALAILLERYPDARAVYTGGNATLRGGPREADLAAGLLREMGIDTGRVLFERDSRNTHENAVYSAALAKPLPGETWLLVTTAAHMPRSMGVFRAEGWDPVPLPVDFRYPDEFRLVSLPGSLSGRLSGIDVAMHEWIGLLAYRLLGYTGTLFPGPAGDRRENGASQAEPAS